MSLEQRIVVVTDIIFFFFLGTPVQNSPQELMSLLCFLMPLFKRQNNSDEEDDGGKKMLEHFVTLSKEAQNSAESTAFTKLKQLLAPFVLRRRKITVLSQLLPPKVRLSYFWISWIFKFISFYPFQKLLLY